MDRLIESFDSFIQQAALSQTGNAQVFGSLKQTKDKPTKKKIKKSSPKIKSKPLPK